jgi:hypothetical protein
LLRKALDRAVPGEAVPIPAEPKDAFYDRRAPAQGLIVAVTTKVLGGYPPTEDFWTRTLQESMGRNRLWIWKDEADSVAQGRIPEAVQRRIARFCLTDNTRGGAQHWAPGEIRTLEMTIAGGRLSGTVAIRSDSGDRGFEGRLSGFVEAREGRVTRFDFVAAGSGWSADPIAPKGKYPFAAAFTLAPKDALEQVPPLGIREPEDYTR